MTKVIVITGVTSGIGKKLVEIYSKDNNTLIFAGYRNHNLLERYHHNVIPFYIDLSIDSSIKNAANFIKDKVTHIDLLVNVAGSVVAGPIEEINIENLRQQFDVNTFSHLLFTQNLISHLDNSKIINVSSMSSFGFFPFISPYCASKRSLDILFNAFLIENKHNIKVISIKPGVIATPIWEKSVKSNENNLNNSAEYRKEIEFLKTNALSNKNKGLKVEKVASFIKCISNLKSPKPSYTIGYDAKCAYLLSLLPDSIVNNLIKFGLKYRLKNFK